MGKIYPLPEYRVRGFIVPRGKLKFTPGGGVIIDITPGLSNPNNPWYFSNQRAQLLSFSPDILICCLGVYDSQLSYATDPSFMNTFYTNIFKAFFDALSNDLPNCSFIVTNPIYVPELQGQEYQTVEKFQNPNFINGTWSSIMEQSGRRYAQEATVNFYFVDVNDEVKLNYPNDYIYRSFNFVNESGNYKLASRIVEEFPNLALGTLIQNAIYIENKLINFSTSHKKFVMRDKLTFYFTTHKGSPIFPDEDQDIEEVWGEDLEYIFKFSITYKI